LEFSASTLGAAITLPICGILISAWGWESAFYITGLVGLAWSTLWFNLVFETPADHPRISEYERHYIETEIAKQSKPGTKVINEPQLIFVLYSIICNSIKSKIYHVDKY